MGVWDPRGGWKCVVVGPTHVGVVCGAGTHPRGVEVCCVRVWGPPTWGGVVLWGLPMWGWVWR